MIRELRIRQPALNEIVRAYVLARDGKISQEELAIILEEAGLKEWLISAMIFVTGTGCITPPAIADGFSKHERMVNFEPVRFRVDDQGYRWRRSSIYQPIPRDQVIILEVEKASEMCKTLFGNKEGAKSTACFVRQQHDDGTVTGLVVVPPHAPAWLLEHELKHADGWVHD
jgi:hypothetical protein